jgi:hypothetical protein
VAAPDTEALTASALGSKYLHHMRPRVLAAGLVALGSSTGAQWCAASEAASAASPARIIDRTLVCKVSGIGFPDAVRFVGASAAPYDPGFDVTPQMGASEGAVGTPGWIAAVRTGPAGEPGNGRPTGAVTLPRTAARRCANTHLRVPLSSKGLRGGPAVERTRYECDAPGKVLVRVRAIFRRPTAFRVDPRTPDAESANGRITVAYLAVTTLRGRRPLVFASVQDKGGKARLFVARSGCARDA